MRAGPWRTPSANSAPTATVTARRLRPTTTFTSIFSSTNLGARNHAPNGANKPHTTHGPSGGPAPRTSANVTILDRMLFVAFIKSYLICLASTLSLYVIVDLFTNIDDFFIAGRNGLQILEHIFTYYGYRTIQYY